MEADIGSQDRRVPPWGRLEEVALHLVDTKQYRDAIVFGEAWTRQAAPTLPARLALCEAFIGLRLLDRAWTRLKGLVEDGHGPLGAVELTTQLYLMRGWNSRAADLAEAGLERDPAHAGLRRLLQRARGPVVDPEDLSEPTTLAESIRVAEAYMTRGAFVKAQGMLERARRREAPRRVQRIEDLLWAMLGDFSTQESLEALCDAWGPDEAVARTERLPVDRVPAAEPDDGALLEGFKQLFRHLGDDDPPSDADEDTSISRMARSTDMRGEFPEEPDRDEPTDGSEHTEILRVVRRENAARRSAVADPSSVPSDPIDSSPDYVPGTEYEDESLVVLTRRAPDAAATPVPAAAQGVVAEKQRENEALDRIRAEEHRRARPTSGKPVARVVTPRGARQPQEAMPEEESDPVWPWMVAAMVVLLGSVALVYTVVSLLDSR